MSPTPAGWWASGICSAAFGTASADMEPPRDDGLRHRRYAREFRPAWALPRVYLARARVEQISSYMWRARVQIGDGAAVGFAHEGEGRDGVEQAPVVGRGAGQEGGPVARDERG